MWTAGGLLAVASGGMFAALGKHRGWAKLRRGVVHRVPREVPPPLAGLEAPFACPASARVVKASECTSVHGSPWRVAGLWPELCSCRRRSRSSQDPVYRRPVFPLTKTYTQNIESGREDLNLRPFGPEPNALPSCATPRCTRSYTKPPTCRRGDRATKLRYAPLQSFLYRIADHRRGTILVARPEHGNLRDSPGITGTPAASLPSFRDRPPVMGHSRPFPAQRNRRHAAPAPHIAPTCSKVHRTKRPPRAPSFLCFSAGFLCPPMFVPMASTASGNPPWGRQADARARGA